MKALKFLVVSTLLGVCQSASHLKTNSVYSNDETDSASSNRVKTNSTVQQKIEESTLAYTTAALKTQPQWKMAENSTESDTTTAGTQSGWEITTDLTKGNTTTTTEIPTTLPQHAQVDAFTEVRTTTSTLKPTVTETEGTTTFSIVTSTIIYSVCAIASYSHVIDDNNLLSINWTLDDESICKSNQLTITVQRRNCAVNCTFSSGSQDAIKQAYNFSHTLTPCATYNYTIQLMDQHKSEEFVVNAKYVAVENLTVTDKEDVDTPGKLLTTISWNYTLTECINTTFVIAISSSNDQFRETQNTTTEHSITVDMLPACLEFEISVYPENNRSLVAVEKFNTSKVDPTDIINFKANQSTINEPTTSSIIDLSWTHPEYGRHCIENYKLSYENLNFNHTNSVKIPFPENTHQLTNVLACTNYSIELSIDTPEEENTSTTTSTTSLSTTTSISSTSGHATTDLMTPYATGHSTNPKSRTVSLVVEVNPRRFAPQPAPPTLLNKTDMSLNLSTTINDTTNKCSKDWYSFSCISNGNEKSKESRVDNVVIDNLRPYTFYNCTAKVKNAHTDWSPVSFHASIQTAEGTPNPPRVKLIENSTTSSGFAFVWEEPTEPNGRINLYRYYIKFEAFDYFNPEYCTKSVSEMNGTVSADDELKYTFSGGVAAAVYHVQVRASNGAKESAYSQPTAAITQPKQSNRIESLNVTLNEILLEDTEYNRRISLEWRYPCEANGKVKNFAVDFTSRGSPIKGLVQYETNRTEYIFETAALEPDMIYSVSVYAETEAGSGQVESTIMRLNPGIPNGDVDKDAMPHIVGKSTTRADVTIPEKIFDSTVGNITRISLLLAQADCGEIIQGRGYTKEDKSKNMTYREAYKTECIPQYFTGIFLDGPSGNTDPIVLGNGNCDHVTSGPCDGPLRPGTSYALTLRLYTATGFADIPHAYFDTEKEVPVVLISILVLSILCVVFVVGFFISYRRTAELRKTAIDSPYDRKDISEVNFPAYYQEMLANDSEKIKEEYRAIQYFSENLDKTVIASRANEKLNRYANISPYDSNRVVLNDDEFENDYINASYVDGYYHRKEYIAAQGPKPITSFDFWRMVLQNRCESIVMLTSLVEGNKVKCHEYFPKINGRIRFDNATVTCVEERVNEHYIKRILEVEKGEVKLRVKHYFYSSWPDHGTPNNPTDMIDFIKTVRNEREHPGNTFIVHCSAGVGRTGTFIALDIMMQRIKKEAKINIFDLVKQLRFQRMKMVQTIDQYTFLYDAASVLASRPMGPKIFQNIALFFHEFDMCSQLRKLRMNFGTSNENIIKRNENETTL